jgi:hypothetical protein
MNELIKHIQEWLNTTRIMKFTNFQLIICIVSIML